MIDHIEEMTVIEFTVIGDEVLRLPGGKGLPRATLILAVENRGKLCVGLPKCVPPYTWPRPALTLQNYLDSIGSRW